MKKIHLFLIAALMGVLSAEAYVPLVREGVRWIYLYNDHWSDPGKPQKGEYAYILEFKGDTVIDDTAYKKLYLAYKRNEDYSKIQPRAFLREYNKRVYIIDNFYYDADNYFPVVNADDERLLLDFNDIIGQLTKNEWLDYEDRYDDNFYIDGPYDIKLNGETVNMYYRYDLKSYGFIPYLVEGIGCVGKDAGDFLYPELFKEPLMACECPTDLGLAQLEDLNGRVLYKGYYYHGKQSVPANADISTVNRYIDMVLGKAPIWQGYDLNGDYFIDVVDVNMVINRILGK